MQHSVRFCTINLLLLSPKIVLVTIIKNSCFKYPKNCSQRENAIEQARNRLYVSIEFDFTSAETHLKSTVDIVDCKLPNNFDASGLVEPCPISDEQKNLLCKRYSVSFSILAFISHSLLKTMLVLLCNLPDS